MALWRALLPLVIYVCRSALGQSVLEVEVGAESVLLPCKSPARVNRLSVYWTRGSESESESEDVHLHFDRIDRYLYDQSPLFRGRTKIKPDALELKNPTLTDSGTYTCETSEEGENKKIVTNTSSLELRVKGQRVSVTAGSSVTLPFPIGDFESEVWVRWTRGSEEVLLLKDGREDLSNQSQRFKGRTQMKSDALWYGDLGLVLTNSTLWDSGLYTCEVTSSSPSSVSSIYGLELARTSVDLIVLIEPPWITTGIITVVVLSIVIIHLVIIFFFLIHKRKKRHKRSCTEEFLNLIFCRKPHRTPPPTHSRPQIQFVQL